MSENSEIKTLLYKFVLNECTPDEVKLVIKYYQANKLTQDFPGVEDVERLLTEQTPVMDTAVANKIFANILTNAKETDVIMFKPHRNYRQYISIAASVLVILTVGLVYQLGGFTGKKDTPALTGNEITLQLANGDIQILSENKQERVTDGDGTIIGNHIGNKIIYDTKTTIDKLVYNTLKIPYGKRFQIQLSDGTLVHLNAGTTLKYPVKFIAGENRQVFLDGEAYFDVAKDKSHPFVVNANNLNIRVLGTHFNVSNYAEDDLTDVVLVEGSVAMYNTTDKFDAVKNTILQPGYKGSFLKADKSISTKAVATNVYTSWINGDLYFRNMTFKNIARKLERRYNITITNQNSKLANEKFNASFKDEPIGKVLSYFNDVYGINYTVKNNNVLIK